MVSSWNFRCRSRSFLWFVLHIKFFCKVKLFVPLLCMCAILPGKAIPEMTYTVSGGTLNPTHSLTRCHDNILITLLWFSVRQCIGDDEPCNPEDLHALPLKHDIISCLAVGARWITSTPLLQVFGSDFYTDRDYFHFPVIAMSFALLSCRMCCEFC